MLLCYKRGLGVPVRRRVAATFYICHNNSVYLPQPLSHGQRRLAMCRCVYTSARTLLWLVEGRSTPRARFSGRSPPIGRAGGRDVEYFIILSAHSSPRREAPLQDTREADRDSREWPRFFFFFTSSRFAFTEIHDRSTCGWVAKENSHGCG